MSRQPAAWRGQQSVGADARRAGLRLIALCQRAAPFMAAAALVVAAATVVAQQANEDAADRDRAVARGSAVSPTIADAGGTFIAAYGGVPYTYPSDVVFKRPGATDLTVKNVAWDGKPFKSPIYYGVRVLRWPADSMFGGLLDFTHSKAISRFDDTIEMQGTLNGAPAPARARLGDVFKHLEFSHGHNMLTLNGLYRLPRLGTRVLPYIGLGAGVSLPHTEVAFQRDPARTYEYQYTGPVGQALIGIEVRLARMSYFIEYKFSLAPYEVPLTQLDGWLGITDLWRQFRRFTSGEPPAGGYAYTRLASHQVIGGIAVRASARPAAAP